MSIYVDIEDSLHLEVTEYHMCCSYDGPYIDVENATPLVIVVDGDNFYLVR